MGSYAEPVSSVYAEAVLRSWRHPDSDRGVVARPESSVLVAAQGRVAEQSLGFH